MAFASISGQMTAWIADNGVAAVFVLMAVDALLPVGGELIMLYAGVLAGGAIAGSHVSLLGVGVASGLPAFLTLAIAGAVGYLVGACIGWVIGRKGGRPFIERRGRWLHLSSERFASAEAWFERHGSRAVFIGRLTPLVRSFISIPAGVLNSPPVPYAGLTFAGSAIWCFAFAGAGWALGSQWEQFHNAFRFVDIGAALALGSLLLLAAIHIRRRTLSA